MMASTKMATLNFVSRYAHSIMARINSVSRWFLFLFSLDTSSLLYTVTQEKASLPVSHHEFKPAAHLSRVHQEDNASPPLDNAATMPSQRGKRFYHLEPPQCPPHHRLLPLHPSQSPSLPPRPRHRPLNPTHSCRKSQNPRGANRDFERETLPHFAGKPSSFPFSTKRIPSARREGEEEEEEEGEDSSPSATTTKPRAKDSHRRPRSKAQLPHRIPKTARPPRSSQETAGRKALDSTSLREPRERELQTVSKSEIPGGKLVYFGISRVGSRGDATVRYEEGRGRGGGGGGGD